MKSFKPGTDIIFKQNCVGLGDSLQFSTLPQRYNESGHNFYISKENRVANPGIQNLVWEHNPYVINCTTTEKINCTYHTHMTVELSERFNVRNMLEWAEFSHGFKIQNSIPKVYYTPNIITDYKNYNILDISAHTCYEKRYYEWGILKKQISSVVSKENTLLLDNCQELLLPNNERITDEFVELGFETIPVIDIYNYADMIKSCNMFYCLYSGGASLASALREDGAFVFFPSFIDEVKEIRSGSHLYPNNKYYKSDGKFLNDMAIWRF